MSASLPCSIGVSHRRVGTRQLRQRQVKQTCHASKQTEKETVEVVSIPESREEAVQQAVQALQAQLPELYGKKKKRKQGFQTTSTSQRLAVEIPVLDDGAEESTTLAGELLQKLRPKLGGMTAIFAKEDAAQLAQQRLKGAAAACLELRQACGGSNILGNIMLVGPDTSDVALVEQLLEEVWQGEVAVLVNPEWNPATLPSEYRGVVESFATVFSFLPVSIEGMLGSTQEGAVLRRATTSNLKDAPWMILYKQKEGFVKVVSKPARPGSKDLELVFYNMSAATSPVAKTVASASSFIRGLIPGGKK